MHTRRFRMFLAFCFTGLLLGVAGPAGATIVEGTLPDPEAREPIETQVVGIDPEIVPTLGFRSGGVSVDRTADAPSVIADQAPVYETAPAILQPSGALPTFGLRSTAPQASQALVPEPGTALLVGLGLAGLALYRTGTRPR